MTDRMHPTLAAFDRLVAQRRRVEEELRSRVEREILAKLEAQESSHPEPPKLGDVLKALAHELAEAGLVEVADIRQDHGQTHFDLVWKPAPARGREA